ncbi:MAG: D-glycero-beta-D-manno-heptose 1-phosphate adenylyltransferase [Syntrophobacterales bacterium]|nr:D-glycero-beta-D-manno-heptose 1-phosphate adenylyltransferase [Syntrophobacterales bacterium]
MNKILSKDRLKKAIEKQKKEGKRIVFTNGCFDILHAGHARYLNEAKKLGDILVLAINSDASVQSIKGKQRPLIPQNERAYVVASLEAVDYVTIFDDDTPLRLIECLKPHIIVKGGDWTEENVVGGKLVKEWGGSVVIMPHLKGISTTKIITKIITAYTK